MARRTAGVRRRTAALAVLGAPALVPLALIARPAVTTDTAVLSSIEADVLGTGSMVLLLATLAVTPLATLTGARWFVPLRKWYGIVFGVTAITDAGLAAVNTTFTGGPPGRLAGHSFLVAGLVMIAILIPLLATANTASQRVLGRYWKTLQRLTYAVWALLFVHLALLEGLGPQSGTNGPSSANDPQPYATFHQRLYQLAAVSLPLLVLRVPAVRRWVTAQRQAGRGWLPWLVLAPLIALAVLAYGFAVNELLFKGIGAARLSPPGGD